MTECERYQELIGALLDGELEPQEKAALRAHVAVCPQCRAMLEAFEAISGALQEETVQPPADFTQQVMARIDVAERQKKQPRPRWQRVLALAACLALVVIGVTPWLQRGASVAAPAEDASVPMMYAAPEDGDMEPAEPEAQVEKQAPSETTSAMGGGSDAQQYAVDGSAAPQDRAFASASRAVETGASVICDADGTPVCTLSDEASEALRALLVPETDDRALDAPAANDAAAMAAPDYTVMLDGENVSIWIEGGALCYAVGDGARQTTAGTAQQLQTLLEQNGEA